jgi:hypothetical protein
LLSTWAERIFGVYRGTAGRKDVQKVVRFARADDYNSQLSYAAEVRFGGETGMINVAAIRMQQFGVQFYQAALTAEDIDKLVRFEVLNYGESGQQPVRGGKKKAPVKGQLGSAGTADRVEREGLPAPDHPAKDRRTRAVLRAMPPGTRPAVDPGRRHHFLRREADV